ncbi:hypothetical protein GDO81_029442 [Engystomops pustulosus]|uniref:Uncharacterized protein n=1 Tax=Engystomops pustulosus TaxID=76066 RepID=A0AAV6ZK55_ENGPU|nr:hypothetical protein GDO81_029442 [Engystomops pustulosus]
MSSEAEMESWRNLVGILFCLAWGLSCGDVGWPLLNLDLLDVDIKKEVDQALQVVNQPGFQGWGLELIKQAAPRMHIGLVELWLQFRKLQKDQEETWRKMKRMMRMSAASCQELKDNIGVLRVPERMNELEKRVEVLDTRVKTMRDLREEESEDMNSPEQLPKGACHPQPCANTTLRPRKGKVNTTQLALKVAALAELLNGHNELLVELYQRMTALEEANAARQAATPQDGSGGGH